MNLDIATEMKYGTPLLVHMDAKQTLQLIDRQGASSNQILIRLLAKLAEFAGDMEIWASTFTYKFLEVGAVDINEDPSEIGLLSEFARNHYRAIRPDPVFRLSILPACPISPLTKNSNYCPKDQDLLGTESCFAELLRRNGYVFWFGAPLSVMTILHYLERCMCVPYRYKKDFVGSVSWNNRSYKVKNCYYVRPQHLGIEYDFGVRLAAVKAGVIEPVTGGNGVCFIANAQELVNYFSEHMKKDPLFLLDQKSKSVVEAKLKTLGRGFELNDFELNENS